MIFSENRGPLFRMMLARLSSNAATRFCPFLERGFARNPNAGEAFESCAGRSASLQKRVDLLLEFLNRRLALDLLAVDEEGRRRVHLQYVAGVFLVGGDLVEQRLVLQAVVDLLLA